jgi:hypothetical protein
MCVDNAYIPLMILNARILAEENKGIRICGWFPPIFDITIIACDG